MNQRQRIDAILHYRSYDRLPLIHFGFWRETLEKWATEGHITREQATSWGDGNPVDDAISAMLGFDGNWAHCWGPGMGLQPGFERQVLETLPDGTRKVRNHLGAIVLESDDAGSIPAEVDHLFKGRAEWEEHYRHRFAFRPERVANATVWVDGTPTPFAQGGLEHLRRDDFPEYRGIFCGSLFGCIRDFIGVENVSYLYVDDEPLYDEIIATVADCAYQCVRTALESGAKFAFAHFWEDICFKNGPLVVPDIFAEKVGPHYRRITDLLHQYGIDIVSLDCDGKIDALLPIWLDNGVNTMFPIEVGTWDASIRPWREQYGRELRGVGGMRKHVLAQNRAAVEAEVERLKGLVDLGGYIPCPDHRIAPDAEWDLVRLYCDRMRATFG
jgi:uroporphyrinogen decarboxylase